MNEVERSEVQYGTRQISYSVTRAKRRKTVAITVDLRGRVQLRAPADTPIERLDQMVHHKARWIVNKLKRTSDLPPPITEREFVSGETFLYLGRQYRLRVKRVGNGAPHGVKLDRGRLVATVALPEAVRPALVDWYRGLAARRLPERVAEWAPRVGVEPPTVLLREQRKRWASCDVKGVIRVNWRIIQAPRRLVDYVVAHELVHLKYRHHTPNFWALLGRVMPNYEHRREALRSIGSRLVW